MNTRKSSVELLRILGCFFVIMAHIPLTVGETAGQISSRLVFSSIMADNVPLFLLAAGFFMFRGVSDNELWPKYTGKIKKTLINVYIPAVIIVFLTCLFMPWLGGSASFVQCFKGINLSRFGDLKAFLLTFNAKGESGHLWYV
ncbi:MAG: acyltransferase family protein, partial [Clostridia bacterium]|nr:acyltransferase family protein [Clostridia bacterium]